MTSTTENQTNTKPVNSGRKLVLISGYYGFGNLGDEAILESIITALQKEVSSENIVVLSNNPELHEKTYGVKAINRWKMAPFLALLPHTKLFISGGGGLFQDTNSAGSTIYYGGQIGLARAFGAHTFMFAQGLGPLTSTTGKMATRIASGMCNTLTVRDKTSLAMLTEWKVAAELTADPVWMLAETPLPADVQKQIAVLKDASSMVVGLSLRNSHNFSDARRDILIDVLHKALPADAALLLMPLQDDQDLPQLAPFMQAWTQKGRTAHLLDASTIERPSQWISLIRQLDLVVAMRLHALIFALKESIPAFGLTYDPKVEHVLTQFGQPILILPKESDDSELASKWLSAASDGLQEIKHLKGKAHESAATAKKLACRNFQQLAKILGMVSDPCL